MSTPDARCDRCGQRYAASVLVGVQHICPWKRPAGCTCPSEFVRHRDCPVSDHQRQYEDACDDD